MDKNVLGTVTLGKFSPVGIKLQTWPTQTAESLEEPRISIGAPRKLDNSYLNEELQVSWGG